MTCQETKDSTPISEAEIYKTIGEQIPFETGMEWVKYYEEQTSSQGRTELLSPYNVSADKMQELLASTTDLVGVAFHHAIDETGRAHIVIIPVDASLSLWSSLPGRIFIDANTGEEISQTLASAWAQNFKNENPGKTWFHFFGKNVFDEMCALPFFNSVEIQPAINILNLTPQLLLIIWNDSLLPLGKTKDTPALVYDASNACPPCAVR